MSKTISITQHDDPPRERRHSASVDLTLGGQAIDNVSSLARLRTGLALLEREGVPAHAHIQYSPPYLYATWSEPLE
jgi:hypothetical protein